MSTTFENEDAILDHFAEGAVWLTVVSADSWPYILTSTEDGDVFVQGFPTEGEDSGTTDSGLKWLTQMPDRWYPVTLAATDVENQIECPHWSPGAITLRKGCTACAATTDVKNRRGNA